MSDNNDVPKSEKVLSAAAQIIRTKGANHLTLESAARQAGVSKGGLLYHYPNKDALIEAMAERQINGFKQRMQARIAADDDETGRWTRAYVEDTFEHIESEMDLSAAVLAAIASKPELLHHFQRQYEEWQRSSENDGSDPTLAAIARLAADGLWFMELLGVKPIQPELRESVLAKLIRMTKGEG